MRPRRKARLVINPKHFQQVIYITEFLLLTNWCLQPSITGLQAWFLHCLTQLHPKTCLFANQSAYNTCIMNLPLSSFAFQFFSLTTQGVNLHQHNNYGFPLVVSCFSPAFSKVTWQSSFLHCCLFVTPCRATNKAQWFSVCDGLLGCALWLSLLFALTFCSNWIHVEKFLVCL